MNWVQIELGEENREAVRRFFQQHLCATQVECAAALGLSAMAVNRHVRSIRAEWKAIRARGTE
jgi:DNA invertase Pin-like site-specific DNA recombinase